MVWERENKRGYQFEDGEVRVFAEPYFGLLQPASQPDAVLRHQLRERAVLNGVLEPVTTTRNGISRAKQSAPQPNLDDQLTVFEALFPEGFHGARWTDQRRGRVEGRRLKRHLDPAIDDAAVRLGAAPLQALIDEGRHAEVLQRFVDVVGSTDLATNKQLEGFRQLRADAELTQALHGFLHDTRRGDLAPMARLRLELARLGFRKLPWTALTAARALLYPTDHMVVRPSVVRAQAKLLAPRFRLGPVPSAAEYSRSLEFTMTVRAHLTKSGLIPRDLFDVTGFMRVTLAASAKRARLEAMVERRSAENGATEAGATESDATEAGAAEAGAAEAGAVIQ